MRDKLGRFVKGNEEGFQKGHKPFLGTEKTRFKKGQAPWNKNKKNWMSEESKKSMIEKKKGFSIWPNGRIFSKEWRENIGKANQGIKRSEEQIRKMSGKTPWNKGIPMLQHIKKKVSKNRRGKGVGERNFMYGKENKWGKHTKEAIKKMKKARAKRVLPVKDTLIEVKIQNFLKTLGIEFFTHQYMKQIKHGYQCDILIPVQEGVIQKTIIECDGDAFHFNPKIYNKNDKIFRKGMTAEEKWKLDKIRTKELIEKGFRVLRLWGSEIREINIGKFENKLRSLK